MDIVRRTLLPGDPGPLVHIKVGDVNSIVRRTFAFKGVEFKAEADGPGSFSGYGSTFGNVDDGGDVIIKGAFSDALDEFKSRGFIAVGHDWFGLPVATVLDAKEDDAGLWVEAEFHSTQAAQDARTTVAERIQRGKFVGLSIGYLVDRENDGEEFREDGTRIIKKIKELAEVSVVTVPMNRQAGIAAVKHSLSFSDDADTALAAVQAFVERAGALAALRVKEGRVLSSANRARLSEISGALLGASGQLDAILADTDPDKSKHVDMTPFKRGVLMRDVDLLLAER